MYVDIDINIDIDIDILILPGTLNPHQVSLVLCWEVLKKNKSPDILYVLKSCLFCLRNKCCIVQKLGSSIHVKIRLPHPCNILTPGIIKSYEK